MKLMNNQELDLERYLKVAGVGAVIGLGVWLIVKDSGLGFLGDAKKLGLVEFMGIFAASGLAQTALHDQLEKTLEPQYHSQQQLPPNSNFYRFGNTGF
jgi:hypothetical protein